MYRETPLVCNYYCQQKTIFGPRQANLVLIAYPSSEGSGEPAHPRNTSKGSTCTLWFNFARTMVVSPHRTAKLAMQSPVWNLVCMDCMFIRAFRSPIREKKRDDQFATVFFSFSFAFKVLKIVFAFNFALCQGVSRDIRLRFTIANFAINSA